MSTPGAIDVSALQRLFSHAQAIGRYGAFDWDLATNAIVWSDRFFELLGYDRGEIEHSWDGFQSCIHPDDLDHVRAAADEVIQTGVHPEVSYRVIRGDGAVRDFVSRGTMVFDPDGAPVRMIGFVQDVTEDKARTRELVLQRQLLEEAQRIGAMGSWSIDVATGQITWSAETYRIFGLPPGTPLTTEVAQSVMSPADALRAADRIERAIKTQRPYDAEFELTNSDGRRRFVRVVARVEVEGRRTTRLYGMVQDITEARQRLQESLRIDRLEKLGHLAGGLAHDMNNYLTTAALGISYVREGQLDEEERGALDDATAGLRAAQRVSEQLLAFAKGASAEPVAVDFGKLVAETATFSLRGRATRCKIEVARGLPAVLADPAQLEQLVSNLCINASQACGPDGQIQVRVFHRHGLVGLEVEDDGPGVDPRLLDSVFEPYVSNKQAGTGLGLATCRAVAERHGGTIAVDSAPGCTIFRVTFPAHARPAARVPEPEPGPVELGSLEVLVYDDDPFARSALHTGLRKLGCRVVFADSVDKLWAELEREDLDLVIVDLTVPEGPGGRELIGPLRAMRPDLAVVVTTGYAEEGVSDWRLLGFDAFLAKPFELRQLEAGVSAAVRARGEEALKPELDDEGGS